MTTTTNRAASPSTSFLFIHRLMSIITTLIRMMPTAKVTKKPMIPQTLSVKKLTILPHVSTKNFPTVSAKEFEDSSDVAEAAASETISSSKIIPSPPAKIIYCLPHRLRRDFLALLRAFLR